MSLRSTVRGLASPGRRILQIIVLTGLCGAAQAQGLAPSPAPTQAPAVAAPATGTAPASPAAPAATPSTSLDAPATPTRATIGPAPTVVLPHNLSPWGMFMGADIVVKAVMVGLAFASVVTWTVWLAKSLELLAATRSGRRLIRQVDASPSLAHAVGEVEGARSPIGRMVTAAVQEAELSAGLGKEGLKERATSRLDRIEVAAIRSATRGTGLLATIGSTAPFVGLFGTVWGIMNAFIGISKAQTTNLAIVAPGIAEALLATAIGLVAAIPAVVIYNLFARWIAGYRAMLGDGSALVLRHLSRDLDRAGRPKLMAAE